MNENVKIVFGLIGGLALFLYGMNSMSDALQKAAGEKMKNVLEFLTKNAVMGAVAGMIVTAVLQSSSATTVMVIGFVSAGLMTLPQAISVIFGANIGTTMTAQLIAFKLSNYIYPIIFLGFMINFVCKKEKKKNLGMVIFSFGLLFEGIEIMGGVMKPLAGSPIFINLMGSVSHIPVLGVILGMVMTLVVQSSSATIAVLQNFASQAGPDGVTSVIGLAGAIPILLGDNIGTTITALLASIGQSKNAKRTAVAHSIFNITGSMVFLCLIPVLVSFVRYISPSGPEVEVISRQIANAHTTFNVVCTLIWLPLLPVMVKIVTWLINGEENVVPAQDSMPQYLDENLIAQPVAAICMVSREINRMSDFTRKMLVTLGEALKNEEPRAAFAEFTAIQAAVKKLREEIAAYITKMLADGGLTEAQVEQTAGLLFVANHIDRIADRCSEIGNIYQNILEQGIKLSKEASKDLGKSMEQVISMLDHALESLRSRGTNKLSEVEEIKYKLRQKQRALNKAHLVRVKKGKCDPSLTNEFVNILHELEGISDNCVNIAEETAETDYLSDLWVSEAAASREGDS